MSATIYNLFRNIIKDETVGDYTVPDYALMKYLDQAIRKMSELSNYNFHEIKTITQTDLDNGYFTLSREPISFISGINEATRGKTWDYSKDKKIRIIDSRFFSTAIYDLTYRAEYLQFDGVMREDDYFDFTDDAYLPIVLYAVGLYTKFSGVINSEGGFGTIKRKSEDTLSVEYAVGGEIAMASTPDALMQSAIDMFTDLPNGQDVLFSV